MDEAELEFEHLADGWTRDALALLTAEVVDREANAAIADTIWEELDYEGRTYVGAWALVLSARLIEEIADLHAVTPLEYVAKLATMSQPRE